MRPGCPRTQRFPAAHLNRTEYSGRPISSNNRSRTCLLSRGDEVDDLTGERRVDVDHPFIGLRMHADDGVDRGQRVGAHQVADLLGAAIGGHGRAEAMFGPQLVDEVADRVGEAPIDRGDVDELGVAAVGRYGLGAQDRVRRRVDQRGDVGVPAGAVRALLLAVLRAVAVVVGRR